MYHIFFIHSSVDGHLGCLHVLVIVTSAVVNIWVQVSFRIMVFSGYMPRSGIDRSYGGGGGGGLIAKSCLTLVTPWTVACQAPLSMGFSRQKCWSGLPFPSPGDHPNLGIEPSSPTLQ